MVLCVVFLRVLPGGNHMSLYNDVCGNLKLGISWNRLFEASLRLIREIWSEIAQLA